MLHANVILSEAFDDAARARIAADDGSLTAEQIAEKITLLRVFRNSMRASPKAISHNGHSMYLRTCPSVASAQDLVDLVTVAAANGFSGHMVSAGVWDIDARAPLGMTRVTAERSWEEPIGVYTDTHVDGANLVWRQATGESTVTRTKELFVRFDGTETYPVRADLLVQLMPDHYIDGVQRPAGPADIVVMAVHGHADDITDAYAAS